MKKYTSFKAGDKEYKLMFTIRTMALAEREIGQSLISLMANPLDMVRNMNISVLATGLKYGLMGQKEGFDPYDKIDEMVEAGLSIDELTVQLIKAWRDSGLFTKAAPMKETEAEPRQEKK